MANNQLHILSVPSGGKLPSGLQLAFGEIHPDHDSGYLNRNEVEMRDSFQHDRRRREYVSSRYLIKKAAESMGLNASLFEVRKDEFGRPFAIYENRELYLSIAHSARKVSCAISTEIPVGLDIEPSGRPVDERLRNRMLHPDEIETLKKIESIRIWTMKEALVKLEGKGLRTNLNELIIQPVHEMEFSARFNNEKTARICSFHHDDHWIAVAYFCEMN